VASVNTEAFDPLAVLIRPAATLVVVRDALPAQDRGVGLIEPGQPEYPEVSVLLLQRSYSASFVPGAFVFAGGAIDAADHEMAGTAPLLPSDNAAVGEELAAKVASLRECFEEAGLLPACTLDGGALGTIPEALLRQRTEVHGGRIPFAQALAEATVTPNLDAIVPFGRWVTPAGPPRRFDTRFFIVGAAVGQEASADGSELIASRWMTPTSALAAADAGDLLLIFPTRKTLERLRGVTSLAQCLRSEGIAVAP
jgi:8-oxo-dGTP pyrophosphatase MutT (NUDIX family)